MRKNKIIVKKVRLPKELALKNHIKADCPGDGCNADQGGCTHDAGCGQHC